MHEDLLERISNADRLFQHLLREGHTANGAMADLSQLAERLGWNYPKAFDAAMHLHGRQWLETLPVNALDRKPLIGIERNGAQGPRPHLRLNHAGTEHAIRELDARSQSNDLHRMTTEMRRAQRWTMLFLVLLGLSLMLNLYFLLRSN